MAALLGLGIDNARSSRSTATRCRSSTAAPPTSSKPSIRPRVETLDVKRRYIRVVKPVRIDSGASFAEFRPYDGTRFEVEIDFDSPVIGRQAFAADIDPASVPPRSSRAPAPSAS